VSLWADGSSFSPREGLLERGASKVWGAREGEGGRENGREGASEGAKEKARELERERKR
jgi:hypothetical protein